MEIIRSSLFTGARQARGVAIVIDVYRAFTSAAFMFHLGAKEIHLMAEPEDVLAAKRDHGYLAVGEVGGKQVPGFDLGNSPWHILRAGRAIFAGRRVAQRTSAGVTGAVAAARQAEQVILGSYVTAGAIVRYIRAMSPPPKTVSVIAMGTQGTKITPEDESCADYIYHLLTSKGHDYVATLSEVIHDDCTQKFLSGDYPHYPAPDPILCLQRDLFCFAMVATLEGDRLVARRVDVAGDDER